MRPALAQRSDLRRTLASTAVPSVTVTAAGVANTKGTWVTLIASTAIEASLLDLRISTGAGSNVDTACLMDIAIGPSGSPVMLVENLAMGYILNNSMPVSRRIWLRIPAGSEIIARCQCATASRTFPVTADVYGATPGVQLPAFSTCTTIGADTATSKGVVLATAGAANTKSAWTQITAAAPKDIHAVGLGFFPVYQPGFFATLNMVDVGVGGAGSEQVLVSDVYFETATNESIINHWPVDFVLPVMRPIAAGERIAARYQSNQTTQSNGLIVYGFS